MDPTMHQLRHGQRPRASGSRATTFFTGAGTIWTPTRPTLVVPSAARLQGQAATTTAATLKSRAAPAPPRAVAGSDTENSATSARQVLLQGKLLVQSFVDSPDSRLSLSLQLVSATVAGSDGRGVRGEAAALVAVIGNGREEERDVEVPWNEALGAPGAVLVTNHSDFPVHLKLLSVSSPAADAPVHFVCNGWVYPAGKHPYRLFFTNDTYVKEKTPGALLKYREDELGVLRGDGASTDKPFQEWDRVYDYALYNDLGNPDVRKDLARPVLGGSEEYPYPRRAKTNRPPTNTDPEIEARVPLDQEIYIPCDERAGPVGGGAPNLPKIGGHFTSFAEIYSLFGLDDLGRLAQVKEAVNSNAATRMPTFPVPQVISANPKNWRTDEEFAREILAGANPVAIKRVTEFPLTSELDRAVYGDQDSKITKDHLEKNMGTTTVAQAIQEGRLYVVDHHDWMMPYLKRINEQPCAEEKDEISQRKAYAARTLLLLQDDSTLKPLAIELSSPHPEGERLGAVSAVYTPPDTGSRDVSSGSFTPWELAKAHACVNDACKNNYVYHWLRTHATMEPFVIAANRQLSVLHPIHKLLKPHFLDTMKINATARQIVVASGDRRKNGDMFRCIHEVVFCTGKYGMEMSSKAYETWNFTELALPNDLIKRGLARGDPNNPEKLELLIKDYPYAVDGLNIWVAIKEWVTDYCAIYYADDGAVAGDSELQGWWREARHVGHADLRDAPWWPAMDTVGDLVETCATIIWLVSAYHAAVSFGQYAYQGFAPNRPTITSRPMPDDAAAEVTEAEFLGSITPRSEGMAMIAVHVGPPVKPGEPLLGQRPDTELWTSERLAAEALAAFRTKLEAVTEAIAERNADSTLRNRSGPVEVPYTLLSPAADGQHVTGIPNSIAA